MKISIWQQFSSNHSAGFTLVGKFKSPDAALEASDKLKNILNAIEDHNVTHETHAKWKPSPVESQITAQFDVEFHRKIDWLQGYGEWENRIVVYENLVFLTDDRMSHYAGPKPFDQLLEKLGGEVTGGIGVVLVSLTCEAPDEKTAALIHHMTTIHLETIRWDAIGISLPPWIENGGQKSISHQDQQLFEQAWAILEDAYEAAMRWNHENVEQLRAEADQWKHYRETGDDLDRKHWRWMHDQNRKKQLEAIEGVVPYELEYGVLHEARGIFDAEIAFSWRYIYRDDTQLDVEGVKLQFTDMLFENAGRGLTAMVSWLKVQGCDQFQINYRKP